MSTNGMRFSAAVALAFAVAACRSSPSPSPSPKATATSDYAAAAIAIAEAKGYSPSQIDVRSRWTDESGSFVIYTRPQGSASVLVGAIARESGAFREGTYGHLVLLGDQRWETSPGYMSPAVGRSGSDDLIWGFVDPVASRVEVLDSSGQTIDSVVPIGGTFYTDSDHGQGQFLRATDASGNLIFAGMLGRGLAPQPSQAELARLIEDPPEYGDQLVECVRAFTRRQDPACGLSGDSLRMLRQVIVGTPSVIETSNSFMEYYLTLEWNGRKGVLILDLYPSDGPDPQILGWRYTYVPPVTASPSP